MIACDQKCSDAANSHAPASAAQREAPSRRAHTATIAQARAPRTALDRWPENAGVSNGSRMNRWQTRV